MDIVSAISDKLGLLGVGVSAVLTIIFLIFGTVLLWTLGLIMGVAFAVIGLMILFAFHHMDVFDVEQDRWLLAVPFVMFFVGFSADKLGVLSIQPLSLTDLGSSSVVASLLLIIICLLVVDIVVGLRE